MIRRQYPWSRAALPIGRYNVLYHIWFRVVEFLDFRQCAQASIITNTPLIGHPPGSVNDEELGNNRQFITNCSWMPNNANMARGCSGGLAGSHLVGGTLCAD